MINILPEMMAYSVCKLLFSWHFFATWMKWFKISARSRLKEGLRISSITQKETWLNLCVNFTTNGATSCLDFLFQEHEVNSSGLIFLKTSKSIKVNWMASSSYRKSRGLSKFGSLVILRFLTEFLGYPFFGPTQKETTAEALKRALLQ